MVSEAEDAAIFLSHVTSMTIRLTRNTGSIIWISVRSFKPNSPPFTCPCEPRLGWCPCTNHLLPRQSPLSCSTGARQSQARRRNHNQEDSATCSKIRRTLEPGPSSKINLRASWKTTLSPNRSPPTPNTIYTKRWTICKLWQIWKNSLQTFWLSEICRKGVKKQPCLHEETHRPSHSPSWTGNHYSCLYESHRVKSDKNSIRVPQLSELIIALVPLWRVAFASFQVSIPLKGHPPFITLFVGRVV